ncbi:MAG: complement resistance protein TraT [Patescibacteria group bacterium]
MSESIFLSPTDAPKTILVQVRNTSSNQNITPIFESVLNSGIQSRGYWIIPKPSQATSPPR